MATFALPQKSMIIMADIFHYSVCVPVNESVLNVRPKELSRPKFDRTLRLLPMFNERSLQPYKKRANIPM